LPAALSCAPASDHLAKQLSGEAPMARITIEDCIEKVPNRFHLVQMTAIRAKQLKRGAAPLVHSEENKEVVTALREIAAGLVSQDLNVAEPEDEEGLGQVGEGETPVEAAPAKSAKKPAADEAPS
jgi:DNA-directed RNA polymerase subunit omega